MAVFSDHIVDVYYSNPELTTVEILYEADKEQKPHMRHLCDACQLGVCDVSDSW